MPTARVIDLSHHNTIPSDLKAAAASGILGCIHKITEGTTFTDKKVDARYFLAKDAGMAWGLYHFMRVGEMTKQAQFFVQTGLQMGVLDDDTVLVADHEDAAVSAQDLKKWLDIVEDMTGRSPVVYSGHILKDQLKGQGYKPKRRLWLAQYTTGTPSLPEGVSSYWLWQYSDKGNVPGISGPCDVNHFDGDAAAFLAGWSGSHAAPAPKPPEPGVTPILTISSDVPVQIRIGSNIEVIS